jgi:hypothetical protein
MVLCDLCCNFIDSDEDPDCFVEVQKLNMQERIWCESCRENNLTEEYLYDPLPLNHDRHRSGVPGAAAGSTSLHVRRPV